MKSLPKYVHNPKPGQEGQIRLGILLTALLLIGLGTATYLHFRSQPAEDRPSPIDKPGYPLTQSTLTLLQNLGSPVEIRYYRFLDPASVGESVRAFAGRVDELLSRYEEAAGGQIKVSRFDIFGDAATADAASADGIQPFNMDKGEACFLGLALVQGRQKETLPHLSPDWEPALEADLSRALARVSAPRPTPGAAAQGSTPAPLDPALVSEVKSRLPNLAGISLDEGRQILRKSALTEFETAVREMETRLQEARQRVLDTTGKSEAEQQAATAELQRVQTTQADKLKEIALRAQAQVEVFERIKQSAKP